MSATQVITTKDGSKTIRLSKKDGYYHSIHGAIDEALHVYIKHGLRHINKPTLNILEMGFGTALNAFITLIESASLFKKITYYAVENNPLEYNLIDQLDYPCQLSVSFEKKRLKLMHQCPWNLSVAIDTHFYLHKLNTQIQTLSLDEKVDLVYYDAFSPRVDKVVWSVKVFKNISKLLNNNAILVTYCANGQVKRNLAAAGYLVETLDGPPGKREMIRANWSK